MTNRKFLLVGLVLIVAWGCDDSSSERAAIGSAALQLSVVLDPAVPSVGDNLMRIELRGTGGEPVAGAEVGVQVRMHAMGAMPAMGGPAEVSEVGAGRYAARFELEMGGTRTVDIEATVGDGTRLRAAPAPRGHRPRCRGAPGGRAPSPRPPGSRPQDARG
jgi:hypothetical protein